ncbi:hypothetical protein QJS10_CPB18g01993 [Acorus calamus]|uniref:Uncharacterized protein n=1 Tax=Acorus calamus TaxID=4465 RepID=A0AAV9CRW1_ACOCL|nr:hypothetical protein QJS10_CPB18g01993 [Acorus calamus]
MIPKSTDSRCLVPSQMPHMNLTNTLAPPTSPASMCHITNGINDHGNNLRNHSGLLGTAQTFQGPHPTSDGDSPLH